MRPSQKPERFSLPLGMLAGQRDEGAPQVLLEARPGGPYLKGEHPDGGASSAREAPRPLLSLPGRSGKMSPRRRPAPETTAARGALRQAAMAFLRLAQIAACCCCCLATLHAGSGAMKVPPGPGEASEESGTAAARFFQPAQLHAGLAVAAVSSFSGPGNRDRRANRELPILLWWSGGLFPHFPGETARIDCPRGSCLATKDRRVRAHRRTRSLLFYGTDFRAYEAPLPRLPHQTWALFHEESPMNNYLLSHGAGIRLFNHTATFRRESDFPLSLQWLPDLAYLRRPPPRGLPEKDRLRRQGLAPLLYLQSHCDVPADRDRYVRELMKHIQVDSYGRCLNNRKLPNMRLMDTSTATTEDSEFMIFISKYKFHLAMENAICPDYMTEKLWRPMHVGAIPVYRGSPSVRDWMPDDHSIILIDDFGSPKELAEYIDFLDRNSDEYLKYLKYKSPGGITNQFLLENMRKREWGVNDMSLPNYLNGFECFICDRENGRLNAERDHKKTHGKSLAPEVHIAQTTHMGCSSPAPGYGNIEDIPDGDSWKEMWLQDYWQSLDQGEALTAMIHHNESHQGKFWDYMHKIFLKRTQHN